MLLIQTQVAVARVLASRPGCTSCACHDTGHQWDQCLPSSLQCWWVLFCAEQHAGSKDLKRFQQLKNVSPVHTRNAVKSRTSTAAAKQGGAACTGQPVLPASTTGTLCIWPRVMFKQGHCNSKNKRRQQMCHADPAAAVHVTAAAVPSQWCLINPSLALPTPYSKHIKQQGSYTSTNHHSYSAATHPVPRVHIPHARFTAAGTPSPLPARSAPPQDNARC